MRRKAGQRKISRPRRGRYCFDCKGPILTRHKWYIDGCIVRHDDCGNPELKVPEQMVLGVESEA